MLNGLAREFVLQILHEPIVISANGFFDINLDLLGSVGDVCDSHVLII